MITEFYETNLTWNDRISSIIGKNHSKIDSIILERSPKLSFNSDGKINIDIMYPPENEIREISFLNILIHYPKFSERKIEEISQLDFVTQNLNPFKNDFVNLLSFGQYGY